MTFSQVFPLRFSRLLIAVALVGGVSMATLTHSTVQAAPAAMYAYTSANTGHWSHKLSPNPQGVVASFGDFSTNTNWRCSWNTNVANHAGTKVFQSRSCDNKIQVIDVLTDTTSEINLGTRSNTMAFSPDDRYLYTGEPYYITKWDLTTSPPTNVGGGSRNDNNAGISLAILPDGSKLYSPCIQATKNQVQVFNSSLALVATITNAALATPNWAVATPSGNEVWIGSGNNFIIVDTATDTVSRTYTNTYGVSSFPSFNSTGTRLWISTGNGLQEINTADGSTVRTITGTGMANGSHASISPDDQYIYIAAAQTMAWAKTSDGSNGTFALPTKSPNNDTPRTVVWAQPTEAPNISLNHTSAILTVGVSASSLYSITNSGGAASSYSISPSLPSGLNFSSSTGLISGTPSSTFASTTYTITATNLGGTSLATISLSSVQPTTTTSTSTTTTTVAPNVGAVTGSATGGSTQSSQTSGTNQLPSTTISTETTVAIRNSSLPATTTTIPAPDAPAADLGQAATLVDGKEVATKLTRSENALQISAGDLSATIYGEDSSGTRIDLDANGDLNLMGGNTVVVEASGFKTSTEADVWMFSTPTHLGVVKSSTTGKINGSFKIAYSIPAGNHRFVIEGKTALGGEAVLGVGIHVGALSDTGGVNKWLIILPIILAISLGLIIPTTLRRRRSEEEVPA